MGCGVQVAKLCEDARCSEAEGINQGTAATGGVIGTREEMYQRVVVNVSGTEATVQ